MKEEVKVYKYGGKLWIKVVKEIKDVQYDTKIYRDNINNNDWLLEHYINFRPWDYCFNAELFADSLKVTGQNMISNGHGMNSIKDGRRAVYAGELMSSLYGYDVSNVVYYNTKNWLNKVTKLTLDEHTLKTEHPFINDKRYEQYYSIGIRKNKEEFKSKADTLWHLLSRYLNKWWD